MLHIIPAIAAWALVAAALAGLGTALIASRPTCTIPGAVTATAACIVAVPGAWAYGQHLLSVLFLGGAVTGAVVLERRTRPAREPRPAPYPVAVQWRPAMYGLTITVEQLDAQVCHELHLTPVRYPGRPVLAVVQRLDGRRCGLHATTLSPHRARDIAQAAAVKHGATFIAHTPIALEAAR